MGSPLKSQNVIHPASPSAFSAHSILKESTRDNLVQTPTNKQLSVHFENNDTPVSRINKAACEVSNRSPANRERIDSGSLDDLMGIMGQLQLNSAKKSVKKLNGDTSCKENYDLNSSITETKKSVDVESGNDIPAALSSDDNVQNTSKENVDTVENIDYKFDFEHFENMDPFKTKSSVVNSPVCQREEKTIISQPVVDEDEDDVVSFRSVAGENNNLEDSNKTDFLEKISPVFSTPPLPSQNIVPDKNIDDENIDLQNPQIVEFSIPPSSGVEKTNAECKFDDNDTNIDSFKARSAVLNSPLPNKIHDVKSPSKFVAVSENIDPFETKSTVMNSPTCKHVDNVDDNHELTVCPENIDLVQKTSTVLLNSSTLKEIDNLCDRETLDTLRPELGMLNSEKLNEASDPDIKQCNLSLNENIDSFKTKSVIANSPNYKQTLESSEDFDPFKIKATVVNSPIACKMEKLNCEPDTEKYETQNVAPDNPENSKELNSKETNLSSNISLASPADETITRGAYDLDLDNLAALDPFKTKSAVLNSPSKSDLLFENKVAKSNVNDLKMEQQVSHESTVGDILNFDNDDKIQNSSSSTHEVDSANPAVEDLRGTTSETNLSSNISLTPPTDETITKGAYNLDLDHLDALDPFKTKSAVLNSPSKSDLLFENKVAKSNVNALKIEQQDSHESTVGDILNFDNDGKIQNLSSSTHEVDSANSAVEDLQGTTSESNLSSDNPLAPAADETITKGAYNLDLDHLAALDPFKTKSAVLNSPSKSDLLFENKVPKSNVNALKIEQQVSHESTVGDILNFDNDGKIQNSSSSTHEVDSANSAVKDLQGTTSESNLLSDNSLAPAADESTTKGAYNLDLDHLDALDPFKTKSAVLNSPSSKSDILLENNNLAKSNVDDLKMEQQVSHEFPVEETLNSADGKNQNSSTRKSNLENLNVEDPQSTTSVLELKADNITSEQHTELHLVGKSDVKFDSEKNDSPEKNENGDHAAKPATSGYTMNFDNLDNFNPFASKSTITNSPQSKRALSKSQSENDHAESSQNTESSFEELNDTVIECKRPPASYRNVEMNVTGLEGRGISDEPLDLVDPFQSQSESSLAEEVEKVSVFKEKGDASLDVERKSSIKELNDISDIDLSEDPFKSSVTLPNLPPSQTSEGILKTISPNKIDVFSNTTAKSPTKEFNDIPIFDMSKDPFKSSNAVSNSPTLQKTIKSDSFNSQSQEAFNETDPLKPTSQIKNSPKHSSASTKVQSESEPQTSEAGPSAADNSMDAGGLFDLKSQHQILLKSTKDPEKPQSLPEVNEAEKPEEPFCLNDAENFICTSRTNTVETSQINECEEDFKPASQVFNDPSAWDMLEQFGSGTEESKQSALARMSLYVKFDPLVNASCSSKTPENKKERKLEVINPNTTLNNTMDMSKSVMEESLLLMGTPPKKKRNLRKKPTEPKLPTPLESDEFERPTVDLIFDDIPLTEGTSQQLSSMNEEFGNIDCQMSIEDEGGDENIVQVLKYSESDWKKLQKHLAMEFQGRLLNKENSWNKKFSAQSKEVVNLKEENEKIKGEIGNMRIVCTEYEKLISELIAEKEKCSSDSKDSVENLRKERDQALQDIQAVENTFSDLHRRYEKLKAVLESHRKNETTLKETTQTALEDLRKSEQNFANFKKQSETTIQKQQKEMERLKGANQTELLRVETLSKKKDVQIHSLQKSLEQKEQEVKELTDLSDQLLANIEGKG